MPYEMALRPLARHCHKTKIIKMNERNGLVLTCSINHSEVKFVQKQQITNKVKPDVCLFSLNQYLTVVMRFNLDAKSLFG